MTLLNLQQILDADDRPTEDVEVPEWGGSVRVRGLTGKELDEYQASLSTRYTHPAGPLKGTTEYIPNNENAQARLVAISLVDEDGKPLCGIEQAINLGEKSAAALGRVVEVATRLNGIGDGAVKEAEGNSEGDRSGGSGSGSRPTSSTAPSGNSSPASPQPN